MEEVVEGVEEEEEGMFMCEYLGCFFPAGLKEKEEGRKGGGEKEE